MAENLLQDALKFFKELFENISTGILFFGGAFDVFLAVADIVITTLVIYYLLKLIRDSRAWQLLKGILLIVVMSQVFSLIGFQTIGFLLSSTLSVLAIAFVVLFQPELRRALETVGRNSFSIISGMLTQDAEQTKSKLYSVIDSIVRASAEMAENYIGALIIIERETKLGELIDQDNAVIIDSVVSSSVLTQIFYKGSPLHDGAVLIRQGRIYAARCHVPLSDNYHLRKDYGTRHRAAIGVSEMGDAIAVVVSEERGAISIAIGGRLYNLDNPDALRTILHRQFKLDGESGVIAGIFKGKADKNKKIRKSKKDKTIDKTKNEKIPSDKLDEPITSKKEDESVKKLNRRIWFPLNTDEPSLKIPRKNKIMMFVSSLLIAIFVWLYVLITVNPVETKEFTVALYPTGTEELQEQDLKAQLSVNTVKVTIAGRSKSLRNLSSGDIEPQIDFSKIDSPQTTDFKVLVRVRKLTYFEVREIFPSKVSVEIVRRD